MELQSSKLASKQSELLEMADEYGNGSHFSGSKIGPNSSSKAIDLNRGAVICFRNVNYQLNVRSCCQCLPLPCVKIQTKRILNGLSGIFKPGMNAIMGPTGSGKSSLLDVLADRKDRQGLEGEILLNGQPQTNDFKYRVGYVVQDDIVSGTLTVRENLMFSANVRLPKHVRSAKKKEIVEDVLTQLGLVGCANTPVGNEFKRGVSGGERKRTNIGMELVLSPEVLFLDEPTTGLDSSTARSVMEYLHVLSRRGRTIIFSIHQPRFSIFKLFDSLYLVAGGHCVYHGPAREVLPFFSSIGYHCEEHDNPADFLLDITQGDRTPPAIEGSPSAKASHEAKASIEVYLNQAYVNSTIYANIQNEIAEAVNTPLEAPGAFQTPKKSIFKEIFYVSQRTLRNAFRNPLLTIMQSAISIILALLIGLIYYQLGRDIEDGIPNRRGAIFFIVTNQVFSSLSGLDLFIKERALFAHENVSGYYHASTYFISKILCDILPLRTIPVICFSLISYFMMNFQRTVVKFFIFFFGVWMTSVCSSSLCFFISANFRNYGVANLAAALFCVLTLVFGGFLVKIRSVLDFLQWIQYFSIFRYSLNILTINEFEGSQFCLSNNTNICPQNGDELLTEFGIDHETTWDLWKNFVALGSMILGFLFLTYLRLRFMKKTK